ncbi:MAG: SMI1/KNR4 family protein [Acidobacteria bacterium]|nr:SMI1/KNR4 family protein [Acidobacteriota bacterium]
MDHVWQQLIESWRAQNLPIQTACREDDVKSFETRYEISLPQDIREYFLNVNGMTPYGPGYQDEEGFSFWSLETMRTLMEENEELDRHYLRLTGENSFFLFCDYMDWRYAYAVKILPGSSVAEGIYFVCCRNPIKIADSFSDFVRLYLEQSDQLYPPGAHEHV